MANLVNLERVTVHSGIRTVLERLSLGINTGDRIGVVGANGGGKSTLLGVLAGQREVDEGRVTHTGGLHLALVSQSDTLPPQHTIGQVLADSSVHAAEWAGQPETRAVLAGLLGDENAGAVGGLSALVAPLSGGERRRLALAQALLSDADLLLLDEPTNHLDVEGVAWLAQHLRERWMRPHRALAVVTHDRWFLDALALETWEVQEGAVETYEGGYAAYVLARAERERVAAVTAERRANLLRKELAWLRRGAPARTSKPKFRMEAAADLIADEPAPRDGVELMRFAAARLGKDVIDLHDATLAVGERPLLQRVTWQLAPGERIGVVGVNGSGKSTLLEVIAGRRELDSGRRKEGVTVRIGYLTQEVRELDELSDLRVIEAIESVRSSTILGGKAISASSLAKRLGFPGPRQQARVGVLSGGERRRLQLLRVLLDEPNVLLLDEPTNDLDIDTLTALEDVLDGWAGTLIVVSHDRYLLERITDRQVALLGDGRIRDLPGGVEEYLALRALAVTGGGDGARQAGGASPAAATPGAAPAISANPAQAREARKTLARVEKQLTRVHTQQERLHTAMAQQANDHAALADLNRQLQALHAEEAALEEEWLTAADLLG